MTVSSFLPLLAGLFSLGLAGLSLVRRKPSLATWCFCAGMVALGMDSIFTGLGFRATRLEGLIYWLSAAFIIKSTLPVIWLAFSLVYSRSRYREFLTRWRIPLGVLALLPVGSFLGLSDQVFQVSLGDGAAGEVLRLQFGGLAKTLNAILLVAFVLILMNLEQTFRAAVGTMRWRIKFVVLALVVIFGTRLYAGSQAILFSSPDLALWGVESAALLIGCLFLALAYVRTGWAEIDVHPSSAVLRSSLTVLIVGGYLVVVGVLAQVVSRFGGAELLQLQAVVVLAGMAGLAVLLLSDRARQRIHTFVARHFSKAQHDSVRIWTSFSRHLASVTEPTELCAASAKLISETFDVLSVTVWLLDEEKGQLEIAASTVKSAHDGRPGGPSDGTSATLLAGIRQLTTPFDLDDATNEWAEELRQLNPTSFINGGHRFCIPLSSAGGPLGVVVLGDRINGAVYTVEELELLQCIGDQITSVLLNLRLAGEVARGKELDAFRTMSAFFVHDLKNAAASLNLMLKNLPTHFDDPAFRQDALRGVGNTARRIDDIIARLTALRHQPESIRVDADLNELVSDALDRVKDIPNVELVKAFQPLPPILANPEQVESVVTNLVLNARDAVGDEGQIQVRTEHRGNRVVLSISDNGCGMTPAFVRESLFRPFQTTKKKGLGIGLFQSRAIVHAHGGAMQVETEPGKGTTFLASFPIKTPR